MKNKQLLPIPPSKSSIKQMNIPQLHLINSVASRLFLYAAMMMSIIIIIIKCLYLIKIMLLRDSLRALL